MQLWRRGTVVLDAFEGTDWLLNRFSAQVENARLAEFGRMDTPSSTEAEHIRMPRTTRVSRRQHSSRFDGYPAIDASSSLPLPLRY